MASRREQAQLITREPQGNCWEAPEMDDRTDIFPAGTHYYKHIVSVGG